MNQVARFRIPYLACSVVAASNELISVFVEGAVCQGKYMSFEPFVEFELLGFLLVYFGDELCMVMALTFYH